MKNTYIGFRCQDNIIGCFFSIPNENKEKEVMELIQTYQTTDRKNELRELFSLIKWVPFNEEEDASNGSFLFELLKSGGIDGYRQRLTKTFQFLSQNGMENEDGTIIPIDYQKDLEEYFMEVEGELKVILRFEPFPQQDKTIQTFILDLE